MARYKCRRHELTFINRQQYLYHKRNECEKFMYQGYTCLFQKDNGSCCGKSFNQVATLVIHSYEEHKMRICVKCYATFPNHEPQQFEKHWHDEKIDYRTSK